MCRKDRLIIEKLQLLEILKEGKSCHIAFIDGYEPYILTLNYGYSWTSNELKL